MKQYLNFEEVCKLVCDHTGKRVNLPNFTIEELHDFANAALTAYFKRTISEGINSYLDTMQEHQITFSGDIVADILIGGKRAGTYELSIPLPASDLEPLVEDGENRAVRWFLSLYGGTNSPSVPQMRTHMDSGGYPYWPEWVLHDKGHLTKEGAQLWLRHLFILESTPRVIKRG